MPIQLIFGADEADAAFDEKIVANCSFCISIILSNLSDKPSYDNFLGSVQTLFVENHKPYIIPSDRLCGIDPFQTLFPKP